MIITIVPASPNLIQTFYLGHPVVSDHTDPGVASSLIAVFGHMVGVFQSVKSLPFQKYDEFQTLTKVLEKMDTMADHTDCPKESCLWPNLHSRVDLIKNGTWDENTKFKSNHKRIMINTRRAKAKEAEMR